MKPQIKLDNRQRIAQIFDAAFKLADRQSYHTISREQLAAALRWPSASLISHHMGTMENFRRDLMREAVRRRHLRVIAQGLAINDRHARKAPPELQKEALSQLAA